MEHKVTIYSLHNHCLQIPVSREEMISVHKDIVEGLAVAKRKGVYYIYDHDLHPFMCNPEHVQSVTILTSIPQPQEVELIAEAQNG